MRKVTEMIQPLPPFLQEKMAEQKERILTAPCIQEFLQKEQLTASQINDNFLVLQQYYEEKKEIEEKGKLTHFPGYVPVLVWQEGHALVEYQLSEQEKRRQKQEKEQSYMNCLYLPRSLQTVSLEQVNFKGNKRELFSKILHLIEALDERQGTYIPGLYLYGEFGVGKTFMMAALCNELAKKHISSLLINLSMFISELKEKMGTPEYRSYSHHILQKMKTVPVLVMDDIGMESMSDWVRDDILMPVLQYRMQEEKTTCFTSNLSPQKLEEHFADTRTSTNHLKAKRLMERILFLADPFLVEDENNRQVSRK